MANKNARQSNCISAISIKIKLKTSKTFLGCDFFPHFHVLALIVTGVLHVYPPPMLNFWPEWNNIAFHSLMVSQDAGKRRRNILWGNLNSVCVVLMQMSGIFMNICIKLQFIWYVHSSFWMHSVFLSSTKPSQSMDPLLSYSINTQLTKQQRRL